jgi:hypothetical protein
LLQVIPLQPHQLGDLACSDRAFQRWDFKLTNNAPCDGYIVQHVINLCLRGTCKRRRMPCPCTESCNPYEADRGDYWEAWHVLENHDLSEYPKGKPHTYTDEASFTPAPGCGFYLQIGVIKFYCTHPPKAPVGTGTTGNLERKWPRGGVRTKCRSITAGILPITRKVPTFWHEWPVEGPAFRVFSAGWLCCQGCVGQYFNAMATATSH